VIDQTKIETTTPKKSAMKRNRSAINTNQASGKKSSAGKVSFPSQFNYEFRQPRQNKIVQITIFTPKLPSLPSPPLKSKIRLQIMAKTSTAVKV
jgi:hypothetical protein